MVSAAKSYGWVIALGLLIVFAVPWFLWGDSRIALGLPLWLWWHILWLMLATVVFWAFGNRAWGIGVTRGTHSDSSRDHT